MVIRESATHTSSFMGSMQISRLPLFSLSWIRSQELHRRIKSYYSTKGAAGIWKWDRRRREERRLFTYWDLHWSSLQWIMNKITDLYFCSYSGRSQQQTVNKKTTIRHAPWFAVTTICAYWWDALRIIITFWNTESLNELNEGTRRKDRKEKERRYAKAANDIQSAECVSSAWWQRAIIKNDSLSLAKISRRKGKMAEEEG